MRQALREIKASAGDLAYATPMSSPVFVARALSKTYQMGEVAVVALRGVDLEIHEGELLVLLGPSGSGKSTLLNILGGLDAPTGGEAWFRDHNLVGASEGALTRYRREHVGFVFQFYNLIPSLTALENVRLVTEIAANPMDAAEALGLVGLEDRLSHFPSQLSGGEQQRVAVARALATNPAIVIMDEPTGNLDKSNGDNVLHMIRDLRQATGTTFVIATHDQTVAGAADRIIRIEDGQVVEPAESGAHA